MKKYAIGIDLGGTAVKYALVDSEGRTAKEGEIPSFASVSAEKVIAQLTLAVKSILREVEGEKLPIVGVGLGTPGIVDETDRIVLGGAENIAGWENIDVATLLEKNTGLPVRVANDANLMGLGEVKFGAARGCSNVLFLTVGTGIGGAAVIDGKLFNGFANRGTELGHIPLMANGEKCACGATGCFEHYASTAALVRSFTQKLEKKGLRPYEKIDGRLITELYLKKDPLAVECMKEHFYYLGRGIAGLINIFSPQRVVIGGGISEAGPFYIQEIEKVVREQVMPDCAVNTEIVKASLGNKAGLIGAASFALNE